MNRRLLLIALGLLGIAGVVRAATTNYQQRIEAFRKDASAQRKKLKLERDREKLYADYPTPEVSFASGLEPVVVCPGKTATVKLAGHFVPGTLFVVESDMVEVVKEAATATSWDATLKVKEDATPHDVMINVISPVSEASKTTRVLDIGCQHQWTMDLATGQRLVVKTSWPKGIHASIDADGEWTAGATRLGTVKLNVRGSSRFTFDRVIPQEELMARTKFYQAMMTSPEWKALDARLAAAQKKMQPCTKLPPAQMGACMKPPADEMGVVAKEREVLQKKAAADAAPKVGCDSISVEAVSGGKLEGEGERCAGKGDQERVKVTGTVKAL